MEFDISNKNLWTVFEIGGQKVYITQSIFTTWVVMAVLIGFSLFIRSKVKSFKDVPSGIQTLLEMAVDAIDGLVKGVMGDKMPYLSGYFFSVFAFILVSNYSSVLGVRPPTSDLATTLPLALNTFVFIHFAGVTKQKGKYFKEYLKPFFIFLPVNIISEISRPVSLGFRLFGNILGGLILGAVIYAIPVFMRFAIPSVIHLWFDVAVGALQSFVFTMLSITFISLKAETD